MFNEVAGRLLEQIARELSAPEVIFPTSFELTIRVQSLLRDPNVSIDKLAEFISTEPLMSSRIVAYANSAALRGVGPEVMDLRSAITRVGLDSVRTVSYSMAVEQIIRSKHMMPFQALSTKIWEHSLAVATVGRILAKRFKMNPEKAFFIGMVHDIGAFYLLFRCSKDEVLAADREQLIDFIFHWHDGIGHALLSAMGQSEDVLSAVQDHEAATTIESVRNWILLLSMADWLGQQIADWVPAEQRTLAPRSISESLMTIDEQSEVLNQAQEALASLHAALF
jgi:HD-like signal output (HDOD) protein